MNIICRYRPIAKGIMLLLIPFSAYAQTIPEETSDYDSLLNSYLKFDSLLLAEIDSDSISFLDLIDSLLNTDFRTSSLSFRAGYTSSILNAGRDYGVSQYGFSMGTSYYHKTGLFADALAYWNSQIEPNYYLNVFSAGYIGTVKQKWSFLFSYNYFNYRNGTSDFEYKYPLTNALNFSTYYDLNFLSVGADYSFLFGTETANRIRPNIAGVIRTGKVGFIDRITFMPGAAILLGNATIISTSTNKALVRQIVQRIGWKNFLILYERHREDLDMLIYPTTSANEFGVMNYAMALPIYLYIKNFTVLLNYNINFPVELPGETLDTQPNSYFGATLIYNIHFK